MALEHATVPSSRTQPRPRSLVYIPPLLITATTAATVFAALSAKHLVTAAPLTTNLTAELQDTGVSAVMDALPSGVRDALSDSGFGSAFTQSLLLILACELGDRTFFVAAILAMKASRIAVFSGAIAALALMTILSALIGKAFPMILDKKYTSFAAAALFLYFGLQLLKDWWRMRAEQETENEELAEVEEELNTDKDPHKASSLIARTPLLAIFSPVFLKAFTMTGLAEWGDRSQIATIALAAAQNIYGVILGGVIGHAICTSLAVVGGRLLASRISEKAVALTGGLLFVSFAALTAAGIME